MVELMSMRGEISAIIPVYNEDVKVIKKMVSRTRPFVGKVVLVDDGSDPPLKEVLENNNKDIVILRHLYNLGQGAALQTGIEYAKTYRAKIVVTLDADCQQDPSEIGQVVAPIIKGKADVVLGSRFLGKTINMPYFKKLILKAGVIFTNLFLHTALTDTHNGFRAFNKRALFTLKITQNEMAHASEIIEQIVEQKLRYVEVPVSISYNAYNLKKGQSNANSLRIIFELLVSRFFS